MRRLRNDLPYTFRPPKPSAWFRPLGLLGNRHFFLKRQYNLSSITSSGFEDVRKLSAAGHSIVLAPNHADHSDPHVMMEVTARHKLKALFMGAREIFEVSPSACFALQAMGVFSVDRDGPDIAAIKTAITLLEKGGDPLIIYPEGEIYHHHERLDPLHEGVASILLKAAARLKENRDAFLIPVAIRFHHDPTVEATFSPRLSKLEDRIGWTPKPTLPTDDRILRLASGILALKETEFLSHAGSGGIQERLTQLCDALLSDTESRHSRDPKALTPPERVRALRYRIRRRLLDSEKPPSPTEKISLLDDLDRVFTALQAHSYIGDYLLGDPTLNRRAETILKLEEDLFGFPTYPTPRTVHVTAAPPIPVSQMIRTAQLPPKGGATELTAILEKNLSALLT